MSIPCAFSDLRREWDGWIDPIESGWTRFISETDLRHDFGLVHTYRTIFLTTPSFSLSAASATGQGGYGMNRCGRLGEEVSDLQSVPY